MTQGASQLGNEKTINVHVQVTPINKQWTQLFLSWHKLRLRFIGGFNKM